MFETFQSGFRKCHSTETAVLKVLNDILMSCDSGDFAILVLLDLTAAFDTVDHAVLIDWLEHCIGLRSVALDWFKSYFANRSFSVKMGEHYSSNACGVPQGSILAPLLFSLYMLPLVSIFRKHGLSFHFYADDTQVYLPVKLNSLGFESLMACLADVKAFNEKKTEIIVFSPNLAWIVRFPEIGFGWDVSVSEIMGKKPGFHIWWWLKVWPSNKFSSQSLLFSAAFAF